MSKAIRQIHDFFIKNKKTLAIAESCSGGLLSSLLTAIPGSSGYFILGLVTYSNSAKESVLKIPRRIISEKGAVSAQVASLMSERVRKIAKSDFSIGITGIAGPSGGTPEKPVGTVFISVSSAKKSICRRLQFKGNRQNIRKQTALTSLSLLKKLF
ncbi:MAG: CinA family protein [Candidatus Omnitrophica bacterium]|nr:CinA family protein [Candidatus Omnitrophota bacterium]